MPGQFELVNMNEEGVVTDNEACGEASWMQGKSQMLDEVNQLVELMTAEKSTLQEKILALEQEVDEYYQQTKELKSNADKKDKVLLNLKFKQSLLKDKSSKQQTSLHTTLHETRRELRCVQRQVDSVTHCLEEEKRCHSATKTKLETLVKSHEKLSAQLQQKSEESKKLRELLTTAEEEVQASRSQCELLQSHLTNSKKKEQKSRDDILALRGRLHQCRRHQEQLQTHCSAMEKEIESHFRQTSVARTGRKKEELRLVKECRKKDELLKTYLHEITTAQEEHQTLEKELRRLRMKLLSAEKEKNILNTRLEESLHNYQPLQDQLKISEDLTEKLHTLTNQLESSQRELLQLKMEVQRQKEIKRETQRANDELLKVKQEEVEHLHTHLKEGWRDHQTTMEKVERQWRQKLKEARSDYERLKIVSTRRCVELAKEVWELKTTLESAHKT